MAENALNQLRYLVIGGSAGSLEVILDLVTHLPALPHAVVILVVHRKKDNDSILVDLLSYRTKLPVREVEDKETISPDTIYLAPPDYHLLIERADLFSLDISEKVHFSRPSIDVTFESVAEAFGDRVIGILLSGANADGAVGMAKIRKAGGYTIVQDPATADVGYMPQQALDLTPVDSILPAAEIPGLLEKLLRIQ
ncbi:chemotaxis protein CheB [Persicitalea jodogahamensis]|uniref:protein-glutamate methylesterase n=1 Tax=Persicitalea jodogahamensis TaxID=402147 RepID=A0A8J3DBY3_9BACT|nr:chemotaxis protein CheB [Persicitalea jodogahamensis]GHB87107.1 putative chemotaxis protein-glutamate methylesterase [Persicitalea jodogahamensis]